MSALDWFTVVLAVVGATIVVLMARRATRTTKAKARDDRRL